MSAKLQVFPDPLHANYLGALAARCSRGAFCLEQRVTNNYYLIETVGFHYGENLSVYV